MLIVVLGLIAVGIVGVIIMLTDSGYQAIDIFGAIATWAFGIAAVWGLLGALAWVTGYR